MHEIRNLYYIIELYFMYENCIETKEFGERLK